MMMPFYVILNCFIVDKVKLNLARKHLRIAEYIIYYISN